MVGGRPEKHPRRERIVNQIRDHLASRIRRELGKGPSAVATVIDSQSVKAAETVSRATRGLPLMVMVTPASLSDRDAAKEILFRLRLTHPEITIVWADSAYAGKLVTWAKKHLNLTVKPVSRPKDTSGFIVLPPASSSTPKPSSPGRPSLL